MRKLILTFFITSVSYAQSLPPGTPCEWWCRAEPVSANGDEYLSYGKNAEIACAKALKECEDQYQNCNVTGCGEWSNRDMLEGYCYIMD